MAKSNIHPIFNKYNVDGEKTICSLCNKEYNTPLNISTAKNHFRFKHLNIWKELKSDRRGIRRKSRHRVYEYFSVNDSREYQCNLCSHKFKEPQCTDLKYHFARYHKEVWDSIKRRKIECGDKLDRSQENYEVMSESSQTGFMRNGEIPELDTVNISSDSGNGDDNDAEMVKNMRKVNLIESIDMENENTEVRIKKDEVIIKGKGKINFFK
ncbi:8858_t:CDS:1 [Racocetra persica]|uniref:8858_t:CDS:1 n=1 Tax=Racocetra persica TaxID=160502 RepID=A0ACA9LGF0_9GLOM|nr:8858_t:CDS:1 [Racocetra persica]